MQRHGGMDQGWQAPIPAFPQRGKESKPEWKGVTSPASIPSPAGGGLGWGPPEEEEAPLTPALSRKRERVQTPNL